MASLFAKFSEDEILAIPMESDEIWLDGLYWKEGNRFRTEFAT